MGERRNIYDEERSGQPSVMMMILFKVLTKRFVKAGGLQF
jgi:hypothetical protein